MLAATIGIDRLAEGNVGRIVGGDDLLRRLLEHCRLERRQLFERLPAIIEEGCAVPFIAAGHIEPGATSALLLRQGPVPPGSKRGRVKPSRLASVDKGCHGNTFKGSP